MSANRLFRTVYLRNYRKAPDHCGKEHHKSIDYLVFHRKVLLENCAVQNNAVTKDFNLSLNIIYSLTPL